MQREAAQHGDRRVVPERHRLELESASRRPPRRRQSGGLDRVLDLGHGGQHLVDTLQRRTGTLAPGDGHPHHPQRDDEQRDVGVERHQFADRHLAVEHAVSTDGEHGDQAELGQQLHRRHVEGADLGGPERHVANVVGLLLELGDLDLLGAEAFDDTHAGHCLLDDGGQLGLLGLHLADDRMDAAREPRRREVDERQRSHRHEGEHRVGDEENDRRGDDQHDVGDRDRHHRDEHLHEVEIARRPAHQLTRLRPVVIADVEAHDVVEQPLAELGLGPARLTEGEVAAERGERAGDEAGDGDQT